MRGKPESTAGDAAVAWLNDRRTMGPDRIENAVLVQGAAELCAREEDDDGEQHDGRVRHDFDYYGAP